MSVKDITEMYNITTRFIVGDSELLFGDMLCDDERTRAYMCCTHNLNESNDSNYESMEEMSSLDVAESFAHMLLNAVRNERMKIEKFLATHANGIIESDCLPIQSFDELAGKIVAVKNDCVKDISTWGYSIEDDLETLYEEGESNIYKQLFVVNEALDDDDTTSTLIYAKSLFDGKDYPLIEADLVGLAKDETVNIVTEMIENAISGRYL